MQHVPLLFTYSGFQIKIGTVGFFAIFFDRSYNFVPTQRTRLIPVVLQRRRPLTSQGKKRIGAALSPGERSVGVKPAVRIECLKRYLRKRGVLYFWFALGCGENKSTSALCYKRKGLCCSLPPSDLHQQNLRSMPDGTRW